MWEWGRFNLWNLNPTLISDKILFFNMNKEQDPFRVHSYLIMFSYLVSVEHASLNSQNVEPQTDKIKHSKYNCTPCAHNMPFKAGKSNKTADAIARHNIYKAIPEPEHCSGSSSRNWRCSWFLSRNLDFTLCKSATSLRSCSCNASRSNPFLLIFSSSEA